MWISVENREYPPQAPHPQWEYLVAAGDATSDRLACQAGQGDAPARSPRRGEDAGAWVGHPRCWIHHGSVRESTPVSHLK